MVKQTILEKIRVKQFMVFVEQSIALVLISFVLLMSFIENSPKLVTYNS